MLSQVQEQQTASSTAMAAKDTEKLQTIRARLLRQPDSRVPMRTSWMEQEKLLAQVENQIAAAAAAKAAAG